MVWWYVVVFVAALLLASKFIPSAQAQKPAGFGDVQIPNNEEGRELPVLFGTRDCKGAIISWYGAFYALAIKKKGGKK